MNYTCLTFAKSGQFLLTFAPRQQSVSVRLILMLIKASHRLTCRFLIKNDADDLDQPIIHLKLKL